MKRVFTIFIGFIHDFVAGCWVAAMLAIYWLGKQPVSYELSGVISGVQKQFFYLGIVCVLVVFATGAGRTFTYVSDIYGEDMEKMRRKILIGKHIILFIIFGLGIYWQYTMVFK